MASPAYRLFAWAIENRARISFAYHGIPREVCPIILGHTGGQETALVWQVGGQTSKGSLREPEWKCLSVSKVSDLQLRSGSWQAGSGHRQTQSCVKDVDYDVNEQSPYNPKRSLGDLSGRPSSLSSTLA
jgi:hypothetical protein